MKNRKAARCSLRYQAETFLMVLPILVAVAYFIAACSDNKPVNTTTTVEVCGHEHECHPDSVFIGQQCDTVVIFKTTVINWDTLYITDTIVTGKHCHRKHCDDGECNG